MAKINSTKNTALTYYCSITIKSHWTQLANSSKNKKWLVDLDPELLFPYEPVTLPMEQNNFHPSFEMSPFLTIWNKNTSPIWTWLREKKSGFYPLKIIQNKQTVHLLYSILIFFTHLFAMQSNLRKKFVISQITIFQS